MPQITSITRQKRRERFNIFLDEKFAFPISSYELVKNNLKVGSILEQKRIDNILTREHLAILTDLAVKYLGFRPRSEKEIKDYLAKKIAQKNEIKYSIASQSPLIVLIVKKLKKYKYLEDEAFALWFLKSRIKSKSRSLAVIKAELKTKGISSEIIEKIITYAPSDLAQAKNVLSKKAIRWQKLAEVDFKRKAYTYLSSKGFDYEAIKDAVAFFHKKR